MFNFAATRLSAAKLDSVYVTTIYIMFSWHGVALPIIGIIKKNEN